MSARIPILVSSRWLAERLPTSQHFRILDASWHLPNAMRDAKREFLQKHITGAQFFDIEECADKSTPLDHMLPTPKAFSEYVGKLGINNSTHVVVYDNHPKFPLFSAQRVWWTFRVFGHDDVSLLEGGLKEWESARYAVTRKMEKVQPEIFEANFRSHMVKNFEDVLSNIKDPKFKVLDARLKPRFDGHVPEPREGIESGHMPGAINLPFTSMFLNSRTFKTPEEIHQTFIDAGVDLKEPVIASCGSGVTACMLALGAYIAGGHHIPIYDGSWTEWFIRCQSDHPELIIKEPRD